MVYPDLQKFLDKNFYAQNFLDMKIFLIIVCAGAIASADTDT